MPPKKRSSGDLVIVESPAKAKTIERYLGPGYTVLASYGHVRDLPPRQPGRGRGPRLRAALRAAQGAAQGAGPARRPGATRGPGVARHRPRPRGRVDRLAHRRVRRPGRRPDPPRDLQRDHQGRHRRGLRQPAQHQPGPGERPAGAPRHRSAGRLQAEPAGQQQDPPRPVGRPGAERGRAPGGRPRARDRRLRAGGVLDAARRSCAVPAARRASRRS